MAGELAPSQALPACICLPPCATVRPLQRILAQGHGDDTPVNCIEDGPQAAPPSAATLAEGGLLDHCEQVAVASHQRVAKDPQHGVPSLERDSVQVDGAWHHAFPLVRHHHWVAIVGLWKGPRLHPLCQLLQGLWVLVHLVREALMGDIHRYFVASPCAVVPQVQRDADAELVLRLAPSTADPVQMPLEMSRRSGGPMSILANWASSSGTTRPPAQ
eukprot:2035360-Alexandrium_andersonii.AAC.2